MKNWRKTLAIRVGVLGLTAVFISGQAPMQPVESTTPPPQQNAKPATNPSDSSMSSQANTAQSQANPSSTNRRTPKQVEILRDLIRRREQPTRIIVPSRPPETQPQYIELGSAALQQDGKLLPEGAIIVERPGRFVIENRTPMMVVTLPGESEPRTLELNKNEFLEAIEQAASSGGRDFIVSAEVTRYRGRNLLTLKKVLQRVSNGNLSP